MDPKDEIKQRVDMIELVQEYVTLKSAGGGSFKGLCPFHAEKTPSFHVSRDKQIWHCFGCNDGGDCFSFLMKIEGMDFPEALRHLGQKVGVEVKRFDSTQTNERQRLLAVNLLAEKFFRAVLKESIAAGPVRDYVERRGITPELQEAFGLGFAPDSWDMLALFLKKRGYSESDGERAGLLLRRKQGVGMIDRFRNRLMVPLRDQHGNTVGFTGRILPPKLFPEPACPTEPWRRRVEGGAPRPSTSSGIKAVPQTHDPGPKYMNSPETGVYRKGALLYGLDAAKQAIRQAEKVIIVEGNLDVIASHKAGVKNVVASSGTALTPEQLQLLKRYAQTLIFSFDGDAAGFKAAQRGIAMACDMDFDVRVAVLPKEAGKDPDEAVQKDPSLWQKAVEKTAPIMQYYIEKALEGRNLSSVDDKRVISVFLLPELARIKNVVEREHWLQTVSDLLQTNLAELRKAVLALMIPTQQKQGQSGVNTKSIQLEKTSREDQAAQLLFGLYLQIPSIRAGLRDRLQALLPESSSTAHLYKQIPAGYHQEDFPLFERMYALLETHPEREHLLPLLQSIGIQAESAASELSKTEVKALERQLIDILTASEILRRRQRLLADLRLAERRGDTEAVQQLMRAYQDLKS